MTGHLRDSISELEERVKERTHHLERRSVQLEAAAAVGRSASTMLDIDKLKQDIVTIIQKRFDLYYVGLFLVDDDNEWAVLQAGTGETGKAMLARKHKLGIGEGMIGWSIANARPRVAEEVAKDAVQLATDELPETRSEAAIPLRTRGKVIGALTVQDNKLNSFDEATISVLQIMADQVSIALSNSQLYAETQEALEVSQRVYGQISKEAWTNLTHQQMLGYREDVSGTTPIYSGESILPENKKNLPELKIPIRIHEETIGFLTAHKTEKDGDEWSTEEAELLGVLSEQLAVTLEGARLYQETQQRAIRERVIGDASIKMRETLSIEKVLQTATEELHKALGSMETKIWLGTEEVDSEKEKNDD